MKKRLVNRLLSLLLIVALVIGMIPEFILTASAAEPTENWMDVNLEELKAIVDDNTDSNGDGLADQLKRMLGLDPGSYDTNEDGLTDVFKLENGLNPLSSDTYGIGISDLVALTEGNLEVEITSNLLDTDTDADGTPNIKDTDIDNDGIPNAQDISPFDVMDTTMQQELVITLGDNPGNVSIQLTPDNLEHLVKNSQVLTWPVDKYGQMSVIKMKAGNVSVVPMLEVDMNDTFDADTMTEWGYFEYNDKLYMPLQYIYEDYQPIGLSADVFIPAKTGTANGDGTYTVDLKVKLAWLAVGQTQNITDSWSTPVPVYYYDKPIKLGDFGAFDKPTQYIGSSLYVSSAYVSSAGSLNLQIAWRDSDGVKVRSYVGLVYDEDRNCYNALAKFPDHLYTNFDFEDTGKTNYETYDVFDKYYQRSKLILSNADDGYDLVSYTLDGTTATFSAASPQRYPQRYGPYTLPKPALIEDLMSIRGGGYDAAVRSADMELSDVKAIRMYDDSFGSGFGITSFNYDYVTSMTDAAYSYDRTRDTAWLLCEIYDPDTDSSSLVLKSNSPDGDSYTVNTQTLLSGLDGIDTKKSRFVPEMTHALSIDFYDVTGDDLSDLMFTTRDGKMYVIPDIYGTDPDSYANSLISIPDDRDIDGIYAQNTLFLDVDADGGMDLVSVDAVKEKKFGATDLTFQISSKFIEESAVILMRDTEAFQITGLQVEEHLGTDAEVITAQEAETTVYMTSMFLNRFAQTDISMEGAIAEYEGYVLESSSVLEKRSGRYAHFNEALLSVGKILAEDIAPDASVETPVLILTDGQSQYVDLSDLSDTALSADVLSLDLATAEVVRSKQVMLKWVKEGAVLSTEDINEMVQTGSGDIEFASDELDATAELLAEWTIGYGGVVAVGDDSIPAVSTTTYAEALSNWAVLVKAKSAVSKIPMGANLFNSAWSSATGSAIIAKPVYQAGQINSYYRSMYTYQEKMAQFSKVGNVLRGAGIVVDVAVSVYSGYLYGNSIGEVGGTSAGIIGGITYGLMVTTYNLTLFALNFIPGGWIISGALFIDSFIASYIDGYDGVASMIISAMVSAFYNMNVYKGTEIISFGQSYNSIETDGLDYGYVVGGKIDDYKEFSSQIRAMQKSSPANSKEGLEKSWIYVDFYNTTKESDAVDLNNRKTTMEDDIRKGATYWSRYRTNRFHNTISFESCGMNVKIKTYMYTSIKLISYVGQAEYLYIPFVDDYALESDAEYHYLETKDTTVETAYYDVLPDNIDDFWSEMNIITSGTPKVSNEEILAEPLYKDSNSDGVPDSVKESLGLDIYKPDTDGDGLTDLEEIRLGTDPAVSDTDGDGLSDGTEVNSPASFTITTSKGSVSASAYSDPLKWDSSGDGVSDSVKRAQGLNPLSRYTNGGTVYDLNNSPEIIKSFEDISADSGETVSLNLDEYFSDPDGDFLSFAVNYGEVEKSDSGSVWTYTYTYDTDIGGAVVQIVVTAYDGRGGVIEGSFFISDFTSPYVTLAESKGVTSFQSESVTELSKAIYASDQSFVLTFSEDVQINDSGSVATISATGDRAWLDTDTDGIALDTSASIKRVASNKVEIERDAALVENAINYVLTLPADLILDINGNPLAEDYTLSFETVDNVYPTVVSISSPAGFDNPLTLTFSEPVYISDKLQIQDDEGELYRLTITQVDDVTVRAQIPSDTLKSSSAYTIKSLGVRDNNGHIGDCDTHTLTFKTGDVSGPTFSGEPRGSEYAYKVTQSGGKLYIPFDRPIEKGVRWNQIILTYGIFASYEELNPASYAGCSLDYTAEIEDKVLVITIADYDSTVSYAALVPALAIQDEYGNAPYIPSAFGSGEGAYLRFRGAADTFVPGLVQVAGYTASEDFMNSFDMPNAGNTIEQTRLITVYFSEEVKYTSEDLLSGIKLYKLDENGKPAEEIAADEIFYEVFFEDIDLNLTTLGHFFFAEEPLERGASYMIEMEAGFVKSVESGIENKKSVIYFSVESDKTYGDFLGIPSEDITGSPCVGGTVKLSRGFENYFDSIGVDFEYYWAVSDTEDMFDDSSVLRVQSADARSYTPTEEDLGKYLFAGILPDYDDTDLMILSILMLRSAAIGPVTAKPVDDVSIDDIEITDVTNDFTEIAVDFSASTNSYDITVPVTTERIPINVRGDESKKSVYYIEGIPEPLWNSDPDRTGPDGYDVALAYGANQIEIVAESESGVNSATYTLNVTRTETDDVKISDVSPVVSCADIENNLETFENYTLSGIYGYYDEFGRAESGSTYQWYRYDSAADTSPEVIEGATGTAYTLTEDDIGKYIAFGVKAKASESVFAEESLSSVYGSVYALDTGVSAISDIRISIDSIDYDLSFDAALKMYTIYYPASDDDGNKAQIEIIGGENVMINGSSATSVSVDLSETQMVSVTADSTGSDGSTTYYLIFSDESVVSSLEISGENTFEMDGSSDQVITLDYSVRDQYDDEMGSNVRFTVSGDLACTVQSQTVSIIVPSSTESQTIVITGSIEETEDITASFTVLLTNSQSGTTPVDDGTDDSDDASSDESTSSGGRNDKSDEVTLTTSDNAVSITATVTNTSDSAQIAIARKDFDKLANDSDSSVTITTELAALIFDGVSIDYINSISDTGDVTIEIKKADTSGLSDEYMEKIGNRPVRDVTVLVGDTQISGLGGGCVTISIPYTLRTGENPNAVVVYYIDDSGDLMTVQGAYNEETGTVDFTVYHFSVYAVGYNIITFADVTGSDWYYDAVTFCAAREITTGLGDDLFGPENTPTRGQFIVMLMRAYGLKADEDLSDNFSDAGDTYYTGYLASAKRLGISAGIGNNMYAPEKEITRQEMFTLLYNALKVIGQLPEGNSGKTLSDFSDAGEIDTWATDAITLLVETGTVSGNNGKLTPTSTTTRAELAQVLYNLLSK